MGGSLMPVRMTFGTRKRHCARSHVTAVTPAGKMAWRTLCRAALRSPTDLGVSNVKGFGTAGTLWRRAAPLGPMPNDDVDLNDPEAQKRYDSFTRYLKVAEEAKNKKAWWRTYRQHLKEENRDEDAPLVNIGLASRRQSRKEQVKERNRVMRENRRNPELEKATRLLTFSIPLDRVKAEWERTAGPYHLHNVARHYAVYRDLFPGAYFLPRVMLRIAYGNSPGTHVHYGNHVTPTEALAAPHVNYESDPDALWTLLLTSPDEHLHDNEGEYVHWLVGNIPGDAVHLGEELCQYLPPLPVKGTGFHRFIFILFKQDGPIKFQEDRRPAPFHNLNQRTFKTLEFYRAHQDSMTPAGLAFFQSQWDDSVSQTFHGLLNMKEPVFEFVWPPVYHPPQKLYPHRQPLRYLDRYREGHVPTYGIY
nr:39S ribosomal protein L38, mitochondrial isoform X1 [Paramormyrops kingsleyae]